MGAPGLLLEIRMLVGSRLRPDIQAVCVTDPVDSIDVHPAPLVGVLILVDVLVLNAQDVQAQAGRPGAAGAGGGALNEVAVGVVVVSAAHGVTHTGLKPRPQSFGDPLELLLPAEIGERGYDFHRFGVCLGELLIGSPGSKGRV